MDSRLGRPYFRSRRQTKPGETNAPLASNASHRIGDDRRADFDVARQKNVLKLAAERAGWGKQLPDGEGLGLASHRSFVTYVAACAHVKIVDGKITVPQIDLAIDCGFAVNPDTVVAQVESAIVFGLSAALHGEITVANGRVQQANFPDYRMLTMKDMPIVETYVIDSDSPPGGVGEPGTPPIAPAVANALATLTGVRQRRLPLTTG